MPKLAKEELLNVARNCAFSATRKTSRILTREYDRALAPSGLKATQFTILVSTLLMEKTPISKIAERNGLERTTLTRNLALLEREGFVQVIGGDDARESNISVTAKGRAAISSALPLWREIQKRISRRVDISSLMKQLDAVTENH